MCSLLLVTLSYFKIKTNEFYHSFISENDISTINTAFSYSVNYVVAKLLTMKEYVLTEQTITTYLNKHGYIFKNIETF